MAEQYSRMVKVNADIPECVALCKKVLDSKKMKVSYETLNEEKFMIEASERTNWLSTSWPAKVDISGEKMGDKVLITVSLESTFGSLTQSRANSSKCDMIADSIKAIME